MNDTNKNEDMQGVFERAAAAVAGLPENLQNTAFEIAVKREFNENTSIGEDNNTQIHKKNPVSEVENESSFFVNMQSATELTIDELKAIYDLDLSGNLNIVMPLPSNKMIAEQQRLLATLYLLGNQVGNKEEWAKSADLSRVMREHSVFNKHLSKNLAVDKGRLKVTGIKKARKYGLTPTGVNRAKAQLKELVGDSDE